MNSTTTNASSTRHPPSSPSFAATSPPSPRHKPPQQQQETAAAAANQNPETWLRTAPRDDVEAYVMNMQRELQVLKKRLAADSRDSPPPLPPPGGKSNPSSGAASPSPSHLRTESASLGPPGGASPTPSKQRSPSPSIAERRKVPTPTFPGGESLPIRVTRATPPPLRPTDSVDSLPPPPPDEPVMMVSPAPAHTSAAASAKSPRSPLSPRMQKPHRDSFGSESEASDLPPPPPALISAAQSAPVSPSVHRPTPKAHRPSSLGPSGTPSSEPSSPGSPTRRAGPPPPPRQGKSASTSSSSGGGAAASGTPSSAAATISSTEANMPSTGSVSSLGSSISSASSGVASNETPTPRATSHLRQSKGPSTPTTPTIPKINVGHSSPPMGASATTEDYLPKSPQRTNSGHRSSTRRPNSRPGSVRRAGSVRSLGSVEAPEVPSYEISSDLEAVVAHSVGQRYAHPKYEKAARVIQRHWRSHMLRKRFRQVKKRALRRSMQKKIDRLCAGAKHISPDPTSANNRLNRLQSLKESPNDRSATPNPPTSTDFPWMPEQNDAKTPEERVRLNRLGVYQFNRNVKKGMDWLFAHKVVQHDARSMATFLKGERTLNRRRIGEFLGETLVPFHMEVLEAYVASCNFGGLKFAQALRRFLTTFHLPGEAQKIERIVEAFASQYHTCNPGVFAHEDTPFVLAFSVVMLNTDVHNPANKHKMTKEGFVRNNRGIDGDGDLPREMLEGIYEDIVNEEFKTCSDNASMIESISNQISGDKTLLNLAAPHRQFLSQCNVTTVEDFGRPQSKQTCKNRTLFLFNDLLVVTKAHKGANYNLKQVIPLLGIGVRAVLTDHFENGFELVNTYDGSTEVLLFRIDNLATSTMAKNFERDLREMVWQCEVVEGVRFKELNLAGPPDTDARSVASSHSDVRNPRRKTFSVYNKSRGSSDSGNDTQNSGASGASGEQTLTVVGTERRHFSISLSKKLGISLRRKKKDDVSRLSNLSDVSESSAASSPGTPTGSPMVSRAYDRDHAAESEL